MPTNGWRDEPGEERALTEPREPVTYSPPPETRADSSAKSSAEPREEAQRADTPQRSREPHSEEIRKIQVDDEDRLAFRVGVNALTLILLGFGLWFLITYIL